MGGTTRARSTTKRAFISLSTLLNLSLLTAGLVAVIATPAYADLSTFGTDNVSATPLGPTPLLPSEPPAPSNEVRTVVSLRNPNVSATDVTNLAFGSTLPAGAVFVGNPTFEYLGGSPNTIGTCSFTTTSFSCTGGFIGAAGNNIIITSLVSLTSLYSATSFTQPFNTVTFTYGGPQTLTITGIPPIAVKPGVFIQTATATPLGPTPVVPSDPPAASNEVRTVISIRNPNAAQNNATALAVGSTLPAGAVFVGNPTFEYAGGSPNTIGTCTFTTTSFSCTGGFLGAAGNNITITSLVSLTSQYSATSFAQPFNPVTFNNPTATTLTITGLPPVPVKPGLFIQTATATPLGPTPLVPSDPPAASNEVQTVVSLRNPNASQNNATNLAVGSTLPAGAVFVGNPTFEYAGGSPNTIGTCTFTTTSFSCTGGFLGAAGNNITITSLVSLTSQYTAASFTQPFNPVTFNNPEARTLNVTGLTPVPVKRTTTTTVSASPTSSRFGQSVTFTATVAPKAGSGLPSGTVTFFDGGSSLGPATLNGGQAAITLSSLSAALHTITANYGGDTAFAPSSGTMTYSVSKAATNVSVSASAASQFQQNVTFVATVAAVAPGAGSPNGTIKFTRDGTVPLGTVTVVNGTAQVTASVGAVGSHGVLAEYSGSSNFVSSARNTYHQVFKADTTIVVSNRGPGQPMTATLTRVHDGLPLLNMTVTFKTSDNQFCTSTTNPNGVATCSLSSYPLRGTFTASFPANASYNGSTSGSASV